MHNRKRILMILTRNPYPVDNGAKLLLSQTISFLRDKYELKLLIFDKILLDQELYKKYGITDVVRLPFPSKIELVKNLLFMKGYSLQEKIFFSKNAKNIIEKSIVEFEPDILYADMVRTAQYIENVNYKKIVDIQDLLSLRYMKFLQSNESNILGSFSFILPSLVRRFVEHTFKEVILNYEIKMISKREIEIASKFNASFLVSENERNYFSKILLLDNIYTNTLSVPLRQNIYSLPNENNFVFIGNLSTPQNISSLRMIVQDILPHFQFKYKLYVVGKYNKNALNIVRNNKNVILLGFVDDLNSVLSNIKLAFMPISFGSGIKTKILDCMSFGIPVLTNTVGAEGLNTIYNKDILVYDNFNKIEINKIENHVLNNKELLNNLSKGGYIYVNKYHLFDTLKNDFLKNIETIYKI